MTALIAGFALSFGLILAIGAQNAFILRQGLRGEHVFTLCLACATSDAALILAGMLAFQTISEALPWIAPLLRYAGAAFLFLYGLRSFRASLGPAVALVPAPGQSTPLGPALATCLALTWLNPHVYLDTVLLIGSVSTQYTSDRLFFATGAISASFVFFFGLGYGARLLRPVFARPSAWRLLEALIGCVMWGLAAKLIFFF